MRLPNITTSVAAMATSDWQHLPYEVAVIDAAENECRSSSGDAIFVRSSMWDENTYKDVIS